jgi:Phage integrase family
VLSGIITEVFERTSPLRRPSSVIDVPPSASPTVARAITTDRASSPAPPPRTPAGPTTPAGGSSPPTPTPSASNPWARTRPSSRPSWGRSTATITAKRLAAALTLQGPPATSIAIRDRAARLPHRHDPQEQDRSGWAGQFVAVPRLEHGPCAVTAVEAWLAIREQKKGALFVAFSPHGELRETRIEGRLVAGVVKRLFRDAGASPSDLDAIGAHSLRRGFVTSADMAGATTTQIMDVTGHRDPKSLRRYTRRELLHDPVLPKLF